MQRVSAGFHNMNTAYFYDEFIYILSFCGEEK